MAAGHADLVANLSTHKVVVFPWLPEAWCRLAVLYFLGDQFDREVWSDLVFASMLLQ